MSLETFFPRRFLQALSGEFYIPQVPGVPYTLRWIACQAILQSTSPPEETPLPDGGSVSTYQYRLPWADNVRAGVDVKAILDTPPLADIVFLYDDSTRPDGERVHELIVSTDGPDKIRLRDTQYQLLTRSGLLAAQIGIAAAAQEFFDRI